MSRTYTTWSGKNQIYVDLDNSLWTAKKSKIKKIYIRIKKSAVHKKITTKYKQESLYKNASNIFSFEILLTNKDLIKTNNL